MRKSKQMTDEKRLKIIQEHLEGASLYSLCRKYKIGSCNTISEWMLKFGIEKNESFKKEVPMSKREQTESEEMKQLRKELKQAKLDLYHQQMRADFYETMVEVAEEQFNISIRKKAGTNQ